MRAGKGGERRVVPGVLRAQGAAGSPGRQQVQGSRRGRGRQLPARPGTARDRTAGSVPQQPDLARQGPHRDVEDVLKGAGQVHGGPGRHGADRVQHLQLVGQALGRGDVLQPLIHSRSKRAQVLQRAGRGERLRRVAQHDKDVVADPDQGAAAGVVRPEEPTARQVRDGMHVTGRRGDLSEQRVLVDLDIDQTGPTPAAAEPTQVRPSRLGQAPEQQCVDHAEGCSLFLDRAGGRTHQGRRVPGAEGHTPLSALPAPPEAASPS